ncbi:MAG: methylated-DNA--[protein]-cysteine S-methyltransferase [Acidimicrobiales bacterium]
MSRIRHLDSPIGVLTLVASDAGLTHVLFEGQEPTTVGLADDLPEVDDDPVLERAAAQLTEYFAGRRQAFDLPLDLRGTEFQVAAWRALADVPYGQTRSYGEQAEAIGRPGAFRAVGAANGRNPIPVILPCHRIVGANGDLTGFAGGLDTKRHLLAHERSQQSLPGL